VSRSEKNVEQTGCPPVTLAMKSLENRNDPREIKPMKRKFIIPLALFGAFGLTACGGDKTEDAATQNSTTTVITETRTVEVPVEVPVAEPQEEEERNGISIRTEDGSLSIGDGDVELDTGDTEISVKTGDPD